ncbi:MAG TPA: hypothetical protein VEA16_02740 [Vicinamibacterales bacterium]|nr:hypothetical protein [Vicinamibacterales bacterium]
MVSRIFSGLIAAGILIALLGEFQPLRAQQARTVSEADAIREFDAAIANYMNLRRRMLNEVAGPTANSMPAVFTRASDALAAAIRRSRKDARVGDLLGKRVAEVVKRRLAEALTSEQSAAALAGADDEVTGPTPAIHLRFPTDSPMATMPPSLLAVLPPLPQELEYRVIGNYLVVRDVDAALILDYLPGAVTR